MPYKKRLYYKQEEAKARDYSLFVIACEGTKTEPSYFAPFDEIDRIKVRLLEHSATAPMPTRTTTIATTALRCAVSQHLPMPYALLLSFLTKTACLPI